MKPKISVKPPGPKARDVLRRDRQYVSGSLRRVYDLVVEKAYGVNIEDVDGNIFLDFNSSIATMNFGHSHPEIAAAVSEQLRKATHAAFLDFYGDPPIKFCEELIDLMPEGLNSVFLSNSGAEAVEAAMKLARYHTGRKYFLAFDGCFHGRTYGALSLTASKTVYRNRFGPFLPVFHAPYPYVYRSKTPDDPESVVSDSVSFIEDQIFRKQAGPEEFAAIFVEPVQGEGGYVVPPKNFLGELRRICDEHGILLVDDEVQSGCFRTGRFLAIEHFGVRPDVVCLAKALGGGLPLGATVASRSVMDWSPGSHASTFGGNFLACAAGRAVVRLMKDQRLGPSVREKGARVVSTLRDMKDSNDAVGDVRGLGLMAGLELSEKHAKKTDSAKAIDRIARDCFEKGVCFLPAGESTLRIAPPLIIEEEDIDFGLQTLHGTLDQLT